MLMTLSILNLPSVVHKNIENSELINARTYDCRVIEQRFKNKTFANLKEYKNYRDNEIPLKYQEFVKWQKTEKK